MTPHDLITRFDEIAEAPGGVERLRLLIMRLAIRGALSTTDDRDPAAVVARQAEPEYDLPAKWGWAPLTRLFKCRLGKMLDKAKNSGVARPYLRNANVRWWSFDLSDVLEMQIEDDEVDDVSVCRGDLVICEGGEPGRCAVWAGDAPFVVQKALHRARPGRGVDPHFYAIHLRADANDGRLERLFTGATIKHLTGQALDKHFVAVPPLAEQKRIVARVDELMKLIDQLDAARTRREQARIAFRDSALSELQAATTTEEVELAWMRVRERFDECLVSEADVRCLRQSLALLLATGRYGRADATIDTPLAAVRASQKRIGRAGQDASKSIEAAARVRAAWNLPPGWAWSSLGDLAIDGPSNGFSPPPSTTPTKYKSLTLSATTRGRFDATCFKYVDVADDVAADLVLRPGDLLIQRSNTPEYVGMAAVFDGAQGEFIFPDLMMRLRFAPDTDVRWLHLVLNSALGRTWFASQAAGTSKSMVKVNQMTVGLTPIPLPPLAEQRRLVDAAARLDDLLDRLRAQSRAVLGTAQAFAAAAVHHLDI